MSSGAAGASRISLSSPDYELLLRETNHRCSNDLQLVVGMLRLHGRSATSAQCQEAFDKVAERVKVLARSRAAISEQRPLTLEAALDEVCEALRVHAEPRSIAVSLKIAALADGLPAHQVTYLALIVNELATNAIKHAFAEGVSGQIVIAIGSNGAGDLTITVDDDGTPMSKGPVVNDSGRGLALARRLVSSMGGVLISPDGPSKLFELRVPQQPTAV